jgi:hypothetical protein
MEEMPGVNFENWRPWPAPSRLISEAATSASLLERAVPQTSLSRDYCSSAVFLTGS